MSRACDLGPGDIWGSPTDTPDFCECGLQLESEPCRHDRCDECRDESSCCVECSVCHQLTDEFEVDEGADPRCVDCAVSAMEADADRRERDEAMRADHERAAWVGK